MGTSGITGWLWLAGTSEDDLVQPCAEQDHLEHVAQDGIQEGLEYLPEKKTLQPLWTYLYLDSLINITNYYFKEIYISCCVLTYNARK